MNHIALFAGMGGFIYATERNSINTVWANEIDPKCNIFLRQHFPETEVSSTSITDLNGADLAHLPETIDLLTAGFPCQSFSSAKNNQIAAFNDDRGQLFFQIPRFIQLLENPPKVVLLENVPTLREVDKGAMLKTILNEMRFAGYWVGEKTAEILSSRDYGGSAQDRNRIFIVCVHNSYLPLNPFLFSKLSKRVYADIFEVVDRSVRHSDEYYLGKESKYYKMIDQERRVHGGERLFQIRRTFARACRPGICPTLTANMGGGGHNVPFVFDDFGLRRLTESECLELQGFDRNLGDTTRGLFKKDLLKMVGNAVNVDVVDAIIREIRFQLLEQNGVVNGKPKKVAVPS